MTILEDLMGSLSGAESAIHPQFPQAIEAALSDPQIGSLEVLLRKLQGAGLEGIVQSWLGAQTNLPVTPEQLLEALGPDRVAAMARHSGIGEETFLGLLAQHLPGLVDQLSANGRLRPAGVGATSSNF
jgi:uncharacterized protein YidB (DUF937 family)